MNLPISWLKEYVDINCDINKFCDEMTLSGSKVEGVTNRGKEITGVVIGKILEINEHPDADKLKVTKVDIGKKEPIQIVTNATNIKVFDFVPVALHGAVLFDNFKIKKGKLRGVISFGMFCGIDSFGFTTNDYPEADEEGVYIFNTQEKVGEDAVLALKMNEDVVEFEITSNRADCFSIIGLAREVGATFKTKLKMPSLDVIEENESYKGKINIDIKDTTLCKRYMYRIIKNVKIEPSPLWLRQKLTASGIRPINNIVDITNYVMLEIGQPMHAFDTSKIGSNLILRRAKAGEKMITLDDVERKLDEQMLIIQDENEIIDLVGVMGGKHSKITNDTKTILLQSANFDGVNIRLTSKKVGLRSYASSKYEKCLDPNLTEIALNRACNLINKLNCGSVLKDYFDLYPQKVEEKIVPYDYNNINKLIGIKLSSEEMIEILGRIEIKSNGKEAIIPTFRIDDIKNEADISEEIARFYGYNNIKPTLYSGTPTVGKLSYKQKIEHKVKDIMVANGIYEALTYSFESPKVYDKLNIPMEECVTISNPIGEDFSIMRTHTLNSMLNAISTNYNRRNIQAQLFEIGKIYLPKKLPLDELPTEKEILSTIMYKEDIDFYDLKGVFESVFTMLGIKNIVYIQTDKLNFMHPTRTAFIENEKGEQMGYIGQIHPIVAKNYDIETQVYFGILYMDKLIENTTFERQYKEIPKYPTVQRDIALTINEDINVYEVEKIIKTNGGKYLDSIALFDIYKGEQIGKGLKSIAYNITFRANDKTLTDDELIKPMKHILEELENKLDAKLRE